MESLKDFDLFSKLPYDLQHEIWKHASHLVKPRVVEVSFDYGEEKFTTNAPCPVLLHVCQTSRYVMLREWPLCFGVTKAREVSGYRSGESLARIPFNFAIDTLCFDKWFIDVASLVELEERERIKRVVWAVDPQELEEEWGWALRKLGSTLPNLEDLKWTLGGRDQMWITGITLRIVLRLHRTKFPAQSTGD